MTTYKLGERVLCFHGPLLYEAKIIDLDDKEETPSYLVHYKGWKQSWDEWVEDERILKWSEENLKTQKELKAVAIAARQRSSGGGRKGGSSSRSAQAEGATTTSTTRSKRTRESSTSTVDRESDAGRRLGTPSSTGQLSGGNVSEEGTPGVGTDEDAEGYHEPKYQMEVPNLLKLWLVNDWEYITKNQQLIPVPRKPTVRDVIRSFREQQMQSITDEIEADVFEQAMSGLLLYFNKCLGNMLLYRFERQQYLEVIREHPNTEMADVYGAEHLLRLLVSMPELIEQTQMDTESVHVLLRYVEEFLRITKMLLPTTVRLWVFSNLDSFSKQSSRRWCHTSHTVLIGVFCRRRSSLQNWSWLSSDEENGSRCRVKLEHSMLTTSFRACTLVLNDTWFALVRPCSSAAFLNRES
ncbi:Clr6 histone deacetylase complex subunit Alp13 [Schizosaccharomyces japonicus yFS275]|uniref:Chromatin modification-related protein EAF3 n=1 Tax=Schizosaccharomyces japonicus (strain yFS275 / FY16936) TaxID=402676 RepID=B6JVE1_SCHJY|nr:Clr6 histone deacetylase complex subunit Alp13 [Schizosaccharomyces japonicus yFS275]EEB05342.2 Clr6 histone deacetylase complex subunit Alp13 [Schizosaccharomyces japonicus yFS275]